MMAALRSAWPQKSAVKTPPLKQMTVKTTNRKIVATLTTMTTALRPAADSTPLMTKKVMPHSTIETTITPTRAGLPVAGSEKTPGMTVPRQ